MMGSKPGASRSDRLAASSIKLAIVKHPASRSKVALTMCDPKVRRAVLVARRNYQLVRVDWLAEIGMRVTEEDLVLQGFLTAR